MSVQVDGGTFYDENYRPEVNSETVGCVMALEFAPNKDKCKQINGAAGTLWEFHLIQIVREIRGAGAAAAAQGNVGYNERTVPNGPHAGWGVDVDWQAEWDDGYGKVAARRKSTLERRIKELRDIEALATPQAPVDQAVTQEREVLEWQLRIDTAKHKKPMDIMWRKGKVLTSLDPRYAQQRISPQIELFTEKVEKSHGNALVLDPAKSYSIPGSWARASLRDNPSSPIDEPITAMEYQVAALFEFGPPTGRLHKYVGLVKWGWKRSAPGGRDVTVTPLEVISKSGVSAEFTAAVTHWNTLSASCPANFVNGAVPVMQIPAQ